MLNTRPIPLTDAHGKPLLSAEEMREPNHDSVVLVEGLHGVAFQRHATDGRWYSHSQKGVRWEKILRRRNVVLVYDAAPREEMQPAPLIPTSEFGRLA